MEIWEHFLCLGDYDDAGLSRESTGYLERYLRQERRGTRLPEPWICFNALANMIKRTTITRRDLQ